MVILEGCPIALAQRVSSLDALGTFVYGTLVGGEAVDTTLLTLYSVSAQGSCQLGELGSAQPLPLNNPFLWCRRSSLGIFYNFVILRMEDLHCLCPARNVERLRLFPRVQFFQSLADFTSRRFIRVAVFTV
jgi:hypothetical protein